MATLSSIIGGNFSGVQGPVGLQGIQGNQGIQGLQGMSVQGTQGTQGPIGPPTIPQNSQSSPYTLSISDVGKHVSISSGGVTIPSSVFSAGDAITIYNNSSSNQTITQGASVTLRQAGTTNTGNRTIGTYGICTVLCVSSNTFVISGVGLT